MNRFVVLDGGIKIHDLDNSKCIVFDKYFKHFTVKKKVDELDQLEFRTGHTGCFNLIKKRDKLKADLLDVEYSLFCKNETSPQEIFPLGNRFGY